MQKKKKQINNFKRNKINKNDNENINDNQSIDQQNEEIKIKIGKIPYDWYNEFNHFGYNNKLEPIIKEKQNNKIQQFIKKSENKDWWRYIRDDLNAVDVRLNDKQLQLIDRIKSGKIASKSVATNNYSVEYEYNDPFPIHANPPPKRNFMPSKWQQIKVNKILDGLLSGRIKWNEDDKDQNHKQQYLYDAWANPSIKQHGVINIAPMKQKLPQHNQSYHPPKQYLLDKEQLQQWQQLDQQDRPFNFIPSIYNKMRHIPFYEQLINERFQRCLDLYLCPRVKKKKLNIDPDTLIPKLPDPKLMKPFPTAINIIYNGHQAAVISLSVAPNGSYFASGDSSGLIIIWETISSRPLWKKKYEKSIFSISWSNCNIIAFSHGQFVELLLWNYTKSIKQLGQALLSQSKLNNKNQQWKFYDQNSEEYQTGLRVNFEFQSDITYLQLQAVKGDYLVTVCPYHSRKNEVVSVHRISKAASESNFIKGNGIFKRVSFYAKKPQILILTQSKVVLYDLQRMGVVKKLQSGSNMNSCMAIHPQGGYIFTGTSDYKVNCFDLDLSNKPYKTMQFHDKTVTSIDFHQVYPLLASSSHDSTIHLFHFKIQNDAILQPLVVPLKVLRGHTVKEYYGVRQIKFHPTQPWIFSVGTDHRVLLWT